MRNRGNFSAESTAWYFMRVQSWVVKNCNHPILQGDAAKACVLSHSVVSDSLQPYGLSQAGFSVRGDSPGKNTGMGCHAFFQEIFPIQKSNPCSPVSPALRADSLLPSHRGNPKFLRKLPSSSPLYS